MGCNQSLPNAQTAESSAVKHAPSSIVDYDGRLLPEEIAKRTESSVFNHELQLGISDSPIHLEYAYSTQQGYDSTDPFPKIVNQDCCCQVTPHFAGDDSSAMLAVYEGHGPQGHECASYAHTNLSKWLAKYIRQERVQKYRRTLDHTKKTPLYDPLAWPRLNPQEFRDCCQRAFVGCHASMQQNESVDDQRSGTTAVSCHFHGEYLTVCNVGNSRVVLGHCIEEEEDDSYRAYEEECKEEIVEPDVKKNYEGGLLAIPLTTSDERHHPCGAPSKQQEHCWGESQKCDTRSDPLCTLSLGDSLAEPKMLTTRLNRNDKFLVIASQGVFKFLSNRRVLSMCSRAESPLHACQDIVKASYEEWVSNNHESGVVVDDMTVMVCFLQCTREPGPGTSEELVHLANKKNENSGDSVGSTASVTTLVSQSSGEFGP